MKKLTALLVFLISSITITGISFIDGKIWEIIFLVVGIIAYFIVGILFSLGILSTKKDGHDAYAFVFFLLVLGGIGIYFLLVKIRQWILSWPIFVKILIPSIIIAGLLVGLFFVIRKMIILNKKKHKEVCYGKI